MKVKSESEVAQSCPTLCDPMDYSLPGSSVHGIFQARVLEWVAIALSGIKVSYLLLHNLTFVQFQLEEWGFPSGSVVKNLPAMWEMQEMPVPSLSQEDPLEDETATHCNLACKMPWMEEPGWLVHGITKSPT